MPDRRRNNKYLNAVMDGVDAISPVGMRQCSMCICVRMDLSLAHLEDSAMRGCQRCRLLSLSASAFQHYWMADAQDNQKGVRLVVSQDIFGQNRPAKVSVYWASASSGKESILQLSIAGQEWDIPWPEFAIRNFPSRCSKVQDCLQFITQQMQNCASHENCGDSRAAKFLNQGNHKIKGPTRLLEIVSHGSDLGVLLINNSDNKYSYTALSHCWGSQEQAKEIPKLTEGNIQERLSKAIGVSALTKTFKHAIELTAGLGFKHIWIDSLCIIQGDQADWNQECWRMCDVYGGAEMVIAAAYAKNGNDGLFSDREPGKIIEFETSTGNTIKATASVHRGNIDKHDIWKTGEQCWIADGLPLFTRAWAFQERMLAKRIVHFTDYELIWECRSHSTCECGDLIDERTSWSEFGPGKTIKTKHQHTIDWGCDLDRLDFWNDIAAQYSARNITKSSDRLPTLASIAKQIGCCGMLGRYLCGIWEESLPHSLLWWSEFKDLERFPSPDQQTTTHFRPAIRSIPSWSWLSIEGRVSTWGRAANVIVRVTSISYELAGDDPYRECKEAAITLQGPTTPIRVGYSSQPCGTTTPNVFEPASGKEYRFDADTHPFEYADSDFLNILTMALGFSISEFINLGGGELCCIILRQVPGNADRYQRIGLAYLPSRLFALAKVKDVIVV